MTTKQPEVFLLVHQLAELIDKADHTITVRIVSNELVPDGYTVKGKPLFRMERLPQIRSIFDNLS